MENFQTILENFDEGFLEEDNEALGGELESPINEDSEDVEKEIIQEWSNLHEEPTCEGKKGFPDMTFHITHDYQQVDLPQIQQTPQDINMNATSTNKTKPKSEWLRLKIRCNDRNICIRVKPWTKFGRVKKKFSKRSGKPKSSFCLTYQGKAIEVDDTPRTLGMTMMKLKKNRRIKIKAVDLPSIGEFDMIGLSDMFSDEDLNGLHQLAMHSN